MLEDFVGELLAFAIILLSFIIYINLKPKDEKMESVLEDKITLLAADAATKAAEKALDSAMKSNMEIQKKDWEIYKKDLVEVVNPVTQSVNLLDKKVEQLQKERKEEVGALKNSIEGLLKQSSELNDTTITLSQALKSTSVQGDWGEIQLRNVVESCGMINHVDFEEQESTQHGRDIPDMIIKLPDGGIIPVDSKCSMNDFRQSLEVEDEDERKKLQKKHASNCRSHMNTLATKKYGRQYDGPIDFTVMLIPFEPGFQAALMHDKDLFKDGANKNVFITSPISLFPLLRLVEQSWRQLTLTENASEIITAAQELKKRLNKYSELYDDVGNKITKLAEAYNNSVGSFKSRLRPSIRDIIKLEGSTDDSKQVKLVKSNVKPVIERYDSTEENND